MSRWIRGRWDRLAGAATLFGVVVLIVASLIDSHRLVDRHSVSGHVGDALAFVALCGVGAYAVVEIGKRLTSARARFQFATTRSWMMDNDQQEFKDGPSRLSDDLRRALSLGVPDFWRAASASSMNVFAAPPEVLVAQLASRLENVQLERETEGPRATSLSEFSQQADDRLRLDQLQLTLSLGWRRCVQSASVVAAALVALVLATGMSASGSEQLRLITLGTLLGGPAAWLIRDIVAAIEKLRR
jgi:hypothetical protein